MILILDEKDLRPNIKIDINKKINVLDFRYRYELYKQAQQILYRIDENTFKIVKSRGIDHGEIIYTTGVPTDER